MSDTNPPTAGRDELLLAGLALVGERGIEATTVEAVCARAGVPEEAFQRHFRDRDDLVAGVMEQVGRAFLDAVIGPPRRSGSLALSVRRFVNAMVSGSYPLLSGGAVRPHELIAACFRSEDFRRRYLTLVGDAQDRLRDVVLGGQRQERVRSDVSAEEVAAILVATVMGMETLAELGLPIDEPRVATTLLRLLEERPRSEPSP